MLKVRRVVSTKGTGLQERELMLGVEHNGTARAYVLERVLQQKLTQDWIGETPVIVVTGPDGKSVRVFVAAVGTMQRWHAACDPVARVIPHLRLTILDFM